MKSIKHINEEGNLWFKQTQIGIPKSTDLLAGCRACGMSFDFKFPSLSRAGGFIRPVSPGRRSRAVYGANAEIDRF